MSADREAQAVRTPGINVTPLVDILLVLLIIFMVIMAGSVSRNPASGPLGM